MQNDVNPLYLTVVIPCFNEEATIENTVKVVHEFLLEKVGAQKFEIVLVNDGSTDLTDRALSRLELVFFEVKVLSFATNRGRGSAIRAGLTQSRGEYVVALDADLSYDVQHVTEILECFRKNPRTDVVVVSPYMKGGVVKNVPFQRLLISRAANQILSGSFSTKLTTVTGVMRGYRGELIRRLPLIEEGKELHLEILRKLDLQGARIVEIPGRLIWKEKKQRARRISGAQTLRVARKHLWYGFLVKPTRLFKYFIGFLFAVGVWEAATVASTVVAHFEPSSQGFWHSLWIALSRAFGQSPHSVVIASVCLILSVQAICFLALLQVLKLQQEETLRHLLAILKPGTTPSEA